MLGWARILLARDEIDRELLDRALHVIERNATAQAKMIDDMLDMARIVAGKLRLEMQPVDLLSVVLAAVDVVMPVGQREADHGSNQSGSENAALCSATRIDCSRWSGTCCRTR